MHKKILFFFLGVSCFLISQPLLRIPIINILQNNTKFMLFAGLNPLFIGVLIAFSAGIFEEGFRFIFRLFLPKPRKLGILEPLIFGLGHGVSEALFFLYPLILIMPLNSLYLAILERGLAIILHMGLTVIIWNGFELNEKIKYLGIAIFLHGSINSLIPLFGLTNTGIIFIEISIAMVDALIIIYMIKSKQYYLKENNHEKI